MEAAKRIGNPGFAGKGDASERAKGDQGAGIDDSRDHLNLLADEMPDVDVALDVKLGENVEIAGDRINLRCDFGLGQGAGRFVGAAERAFDLDEKDLHRLIAPDWCSLVRSLPRRGPYPIALGRSPERFWSRGGR